MHASSAVTSAVTSAGHVPMLADPAYCDLVQNIGVASLGADEKQIWHLTKLYWFTVEFGVVREGDKVKGFGAGVLSSYGELQHMASGTPAHALHWDSVLVFITFGTGQYRQNLLPFSLSRGCHVPLLGLCL